MTDVFARNADVLRTATEAYRLAMEPIIQMNDVISQSFVDLGISIGEGMGNMLSGMENFESAGDKILVAVGDFASKFGALLIAIGIGEEAFIKSIGNPVALIAIGITLVALGAATRALLKNRAGAIGGGGGGGTGRGYPSYATVGQTVQFDAVIKGEDIYLSNQRTAARYGRIGIGG